MTPFWDDRVAQWVSREIWGRIDGFENVRAMGVLKKDGTLAAGLVFHNWEPEAGLMEMSGAAADPRWMTRRVLTVAFSYVFDGCGCQMALARHSAKNTPARKIWQALGAQEHRIPRLYGRETDGIVATLTDDAWRVSKFNEARHGQEKPRTAAA